MSIQGFRATLLPNEADSVIVDKEIALRWSTEDTEENWEWWDYSWESREGEYYFDPWDGCDCNGYWGGWSWVEDDPDDGSDYDCDDRDWMVEYLPDYDYDDVLYDDDDFVFLPLVFRMTL
ncbi:MAG: hypothetical protein NTZ13_03260 [Candidatus Parcubacteria bacterium]|nr:hypothetical protein [Candidatus Parcubacteria bacterium]